MHHYVLFAALLLGAAAQVADPSAMTFARDDDRYMKGLLTCACSPTGRGITDEATKIITAALLQAKASLDGDGDVVEKRGAAIIFVANGLKDCSGKAGYEACINAAANARARFGTPLCSHDSVTGRNVRPEGDGLVTLGKCSADSKFVSTPLGPITTVAPTTTPKPKPSPSKSPAAKKTTPPAVIIPKPSASPSKKPVKKPAPPSPKPKPSKSSSPKPSKSSSPPATPSCWPSTSPSPSISPDMKRPCVATSWLKEQGLSHYALVHSGAARVLCLPVSGLPCGTHGHLLRDANGRLVTYQEVCKARGDCTETSTPVSQLSHTHDWSVHTAGGLGLTSLSVHPEDTGRYVIRLADKLNAAGFGRVCDAFAMLSHHAADLVAFAQKFVLFPIPVRS